MTAFVVTNVVNFKVRMDWRMNVAKHSTVSFKYCPMLVSNGDSAIRRKAFNVAIRVTSFLSLVCNNDQISVQNVYL